MAPHRFRSYLLFAFALVLIAMAGCQKEVPADTETTGDTPDDTAGDTTDDTPEDTAGDPTDDTQEDTAGDPTDDIPEDNTGTDLSIDDYFGTNAPSYFTDTPTDYELFETNVLFQGGLDGLNHEHTAAQGAGKFSFNRIYRASRHGLSLGEQFGIFHWWLSSYGNNSIEGGVWVNPKAAGPHYYPTLHIAGIGDKYHACNDVQFGSGLYERFVGDRWLTMVQISNQILTVPGVNIAFDKDQEPHQDDNGLWIGWGWSYLNLDHPRNYKFWMSFIESYNYQGPVNGYLPEHFNWIDPDKVEDGSFQQRRNSENPFGTFATLGSNRNGGIANEQYSQGLDFGNDTYYVPVPRMPNHKDREYIVAHMQSIESQVMEDYSTAIKTGGDFTSLIESEFLSFEGLYQSTHSRLKVTETIDNEEHLTVIEPPYTIGFDNYLGYVDWDTTTALAQQARADNNGYMHYRKLEDKWTVEQGASQSYRDHPHIYRSELIAAPDAVVRVPEVDNQFFSYKERDTTHPDFANWDITGKTRYETVLQNGSTATYVWFKFIEQPAMKTAQQNWPTVYTDAYLDSLQSYIETLHTKIAESSTLNPSDPVFINYRTPGEANAFDPHLVQIDPAQTVSAPEGFQIGYVPVVISIYHAEEYSMNGIGTQAAPDDPCANSDWTDTYFPDIP